MPLVNGVVIPDTKKVNGVILPSFLPTDLEIEIQKMSPKLSDIIVTGYPKCGNNWLSHIIGLLLRRGEPVKGNDFYSDCPFLGQTGLEDLEKRPSPRSYRLHYDYNRVPKCPEAKYIIIVRNPKDCVTSLYHFIRNDAFGFKDGDFQVLFDLFMKGEVIYNDYFEHVISWYEHRKDPNVLFLYYEKLKEDAVQAIKDIANFMGPEFGEMVKDQSILNSVVNKSSFKKMKESSEQDMLSTVKSDETGKKGGSNVFRHVLLDIASRLGSKEEVPYKFSRKGIVGDWRNMFTSEQSKVMDAKIDEKLKGTEMYHYWMSIGCI